MAPRPLPIILAATCVGLQGLGILGLTIWTAVQFFSFGQAQLPMSVQIAMLVIYLIFAGLYFLVAISMFRGKGWTRSAAVAIEMIVLILAFSFFSVNNPLATTLGVAMLLSGVVVIGSLFTQQAARFLGKDRQGGRAAA
ncbi:hypothetical protein [Micrococcoides hystricis]|uniref:Uncharacterized protein n=1 Tax=Micrococcoides hystricis TaxID=1572761 RepID=A0ABV6P869_9MICC